jgi:hypothetical protein
MLAAILNQAFSPTGVRQGTGAKEEVSDTIRKQLGESRTWGVVQISASSTPGC